MNIEAAPSVPSDGDEPQECDVCGAEDTFVLYDNDKVCTECGHAPDAREQTFDTDRNRDPWLSWWEHRNEHYSGWYGEGRVRFVGGFKKVW